MSNACPQLGDKIERQTKLEEHGISEAVRKYQETKRKYEANGQAHELPPQMRLMSRFLEPVMDGIDLFKIDYKIAGKLETTRPLIQAVPTPELAYITLRVVLDMMTVVQPLQRVAIQVGRAVEEFLDYCEFQKTHTGILVNMEKRFAKNCSSDGHKRRAISAKRAHINEREDMQSIKTQDWDELTQFHVGLKLVDILIAATGMAEKTRNDFEKNDDECKRMVVLTPTNDTLEWIAKAHESFEVMRPHVLPMVVRPRPWTDLKGGGFLIPTGHKGKLINSRIKAHRTNQQVDQMGDVFNAVNALQDTKWRINKAILEVAQQVWETPDGLGLLPDTSDVEDRLPVKPWTTDKQFEQAKERAKELAKEGKKDAKWSEILQWKATSAEVYGEYHRERSARIAAAKKLAIGTQLKNEDELYFVHFLDWRGRIYPRAPFVNPQSDDLGSALIEFGDGEPLTETGVRWLAVHVANSYGYDKASRNDRIKWVHEHEDQILACARDPLGEGYLWRELDENGKPKADAPFCFLASCMAWAQYKAEGPDAIIHLPIQVDGSCNGLQHFAMLLSDEVGAKAVNVAPEADWDTKPSDVYGLVAAELQKSLDVECNLIGEVYKEKEVKGKSTKKYYRHELAAMIQGHVSRSLVKRNVMTTPYGATKRGMQGQNKKILGDHGIFPAEEDLMVVVQYLTDLVYDAIGQVVVSARSAMDWTHQLAAAYNEEEREIIWTTPSGFTVTQGYRKRKSQRIDTVFGKERVQLILTDDTPQLDKSKQKMGIAPNFIHSLDATHLCWTVNECKRRGINHFSMIHDSYGTHARHMDTLSSVLREEAVRLYKGKDYLKDLEMKARSEVQATKLPPAPDKGRLDHDLVLKNAHFFG